MTNYVNKEGNSLQIRLHQKNIKLGIILAKKDKKNPLKCSLVRKVQWKRMVAHKYVALKIFIKRTKQDWLILNSKTLQSCISLFSMFMLKWIL